MPATTGRARTAAALLPAVALTLGLLASPGAAAATTTRTGAAPVPSVRHAPATPHPAVTPPTAYVAVSVANLWTRPATARAVDAPSLTNPVDMRSWLAHLTVDQRYWLSAGNKVGTEVLLGERVYVLARRGAWTEVAVPSLPKPGSPYGYPGWLPTVQLTAHAPAVTSAMATVTRPTTWVYSSTTLADGTRPRLLEVSFGTRLPLTARGTTWMTVVLPTGSTGVVARTTVAYAAAATLGVLPRTRADLVRTARMFLGLPYLWAGTSGYGYDCSGLTYAVLKTHGLLIGRDAADQTDYGHAVSRAALLPGDLVFFRSGRYVDHVGMYVGGGRMIEAPHTGASVRVVVVPRTGYWGARRYL